MMDNKFNDFPEELSLKVFSYLNFKELRQIQPVCREWYRLTEDPSIYKNITLTQKDGGECRNVSELINGKKRLVELNLYNRWDSDYILKCVANNCPELKKLSVLKGKFTSDALMSICESCSHITELALPNCTLGNSDVSHLSKLINLSSLDISGCTVYNAKEVGELLDGLPHLKELNIMHLLFRGGENEGMREIIPSKHGALTNLLFDGYLLRLGELKRICSSNKNMHIFGVSYMEVNLSGDYVSKEDVLALLQMPKLVWLKMPHLVIEASLLEEVLMHHNLSRLRHLDLESCEKMEDYHMELIGEGFPLLSYLNISRCPKISDRGIEYCRPSLKFLIAKDLHQLKGACLLNIPQQLPHLTLLDLSFCSSLDGSFVRTLLGLMPLLALRWWNDELMEDHHNARFNELKDGKEMKPRISIREVKQAYEITQEV